jgi:hypothetical protein
MLIGMPGHFRLATPDRSAALFGYHCPELFGKDGVKEEEMKKVTEERCPIGLRKKSGDRTRVGTMLAELDPKPEIAGPVSSLPSSHQARTDPTYIVSGILKSLQGSHGQRTAGDLYQGPQPYLCSAWAGTWWGGGGVGT